MLNAFRSLAKTWLGKILGAFLIVGLAGFGISNVIGQLGSNNVATVAGEDITIRDFQRAYNNQLNTLAQQMGKMPTNQEAVAFGVPSITLNRLASEAAINKFSENLGIGVSDDKLGQLLREDPSFAGTLGGFDSANFTRVLQQNGFTQAEYLKLQTNAARRQQLASGLFAGSPIPQAALDLVRRYSGDTRSIDYFVVNAQSLPSVAEPTDEDLAAFLKEHQADFRTKETRTVDLLVLSPETLATNKVIPEDQISAEYDRTKASRVKIEKRAIQQVVLATPEQQTLFEQGQAAGKPLADLLAESKLTTTDLGTLAKTEVTDPALAEAAFGLAKAGDFVIIEGIGGKRVVTVSSIEPGSQTTLAEAHDEIAKQLAVAQARNEYADILDQIEELRAAFKPLGEIADRFGLKTYSVALTPGAPELASQTDIAPEERDRIATAIFASQQGDLAPTVSLSSTRNLWFDIKKVDAARDQTLAEVHDAVATAWTNQKTEEALAAEVTKLTDELKAGTSLADVASSIGQFPTPSQPLNRGGDGTNVLNAAVAQEVFAGGPGHFGSAVNGDGDHVIFQVTDINAVEPGEAKPQEQQFVENSTRDTLYADFVTGVRSETGMQINQQALNQLLSLDTQGQ